ncbi:MAG: hypothetical protein HY099_03260 [Nitrospirae bacterium]|nr:hypothetical protein [Nitrospirota bacterium]
MKKIIFSNIGIKILSVVLALSTWIFVTSRGQTEMAVDAHIGFKNVPKGLEILRENVKTVSLNLRGHERLLKSLRPMDIGVVIDLSNARKGEATYYFDKGNVVAPRSVEILRMEPTSVKVTLDESISKVVPVKASFTGRPENGYKIASIEVKPSSVRIEGAKTELARIAVLRTETIDITGLDTDIMQNVRLNTNGRNIRTKTLEVTLNIRIKKAGK